MFGLLRTVAAFKEITIFADFEQATLPSKDRENKDCENLSQRINASCHSGSSPLPLDAELDGA